VNSDSPWVPGVLIVVLGGGLGGYRLYAAHKAGTLPTSLLVAILTGVLLVVVAVGVAVVRMLRGRARGDGKARHLAPPAELTGIKPTDARRSAARLLPGADLKNPDNLGVPLGRTVRGKVVLRQDWESVGLIVAGPRIGKSTSYCVPAIVGAPGPVVATSNKVDLHDTTRGVREQVGRVWLFDPQRLTGREPEFWVDLLAPVVSLSAARELAGTFHAAYVDPKASSDAFFTPTGVELVALALFAAALGGGDLIHVTHWLGRPSDDTPATILDGHGFRDAAESLREKSTAAGNQRSGTYATARLVMSVMDEPVFARWVTPTTRVEFVLRHDAERGYERRSQTALRKSPPLLDLLAFARSHDTLYALSKEGRGAATQLTAAVVAQVFTAAERAAVVNGGRLPVPLVMVLDEAANVCRIRELPDLYSHLGSRGVVVQTVLQSWSQGVRVWGDDGMASLWTAANVKIYAGNNSEDRFLQFLSNLIGPHEVRRRSTSSSATASSTSYSTALEPIFTVADLQSLPRGRALLLSAGNRPTLLRAVPWMDGPHAEAIRASAATYAGGGGLPAFVDGHLVDPNAPATVDPLARPAPVKALQW
jgi:hypothetical protein